MNIDYPEIVETVKKAGSLLLNDWTKSREVTSKGHSNHVTHLDFILQNYLIKKINHITDGRCQFISEEKVNNADYSNTFVIDPIDGTNNFIHGYPHCSISVAHLVSGETMFGVIYNPLSEELFMAHKGEGAYLNSQKISTSRTPSTDKSIIGFGLPYDRQKTETIFYLAQSVFEGCEDLKRRGSASLDLADVASGRLDGYFELDLKPWDYYAGALLVTEAGGNFYETDKFGFPFVVATNGLIDNDLFRLLCIKNS